MNILCATDNNYVQHCYIMLLSLFDNNASNDVDVYIFVSKLTEENKHALKSISKNPSHRVNLIAVEDKLEYCPIREGDNITIVSYYRLLAPTLLPKEIEKILYLDVDTIVCQDLSELYNSDIDGYGVGAVLDFRYLGKEDYERLGYSPSLGYINAGVLLMNLNYWREHRIMEECLDFIRDFPEKNKFHDQDAINYVLRERKKLLPIKYNFQITFLFRAIEFEPHIRKEIHSIVEQKSFCIVHYLTYNKPWKKGCTTPYREYYYKYKARSPYAKTPLISTQRKPLSWCIKRGLYNLCAWFGIVKPIKTYIVKNGKLDLD